MIYIKDKRLKLLYEKGDRSKVPLDSVDTIERILQHLESAKNLSDMNLPRYRLHPLKGDLSEFHAVKVSANLRIIFRFRKGSFYDVELIDYH